jgi:hypothetical protein
MVIILVEYSRFLDLVGGDPNESIGSQARSGKLLVTGKPNIGEVTNQ